jgi:NAD(P) transhydrogenase
VTASSLTPKHLVRHSSASHTPSAGQPAAEAAADVDAKVLPPTKPFEQLTVGVPRETFPGERRVAITPANVKLLLKKGFNKVVVPPTSMPAPPSSTAPLQFSSPPISSSRSVARPPPR